MRVNTNLFPACYIRKPQYSEVPFVILVLFTCLEGPSFLHRFLYLFVCDFLSPPAQISVNILIQLRLC